MFEFMIIYCIVVTCKHWNLRGKSYDELTLKQRSLVSKALSKEYSWRRKNYTSETYLPRLQKVTVFTLVLAIVLTIAYLSLIILFIIYGF